MFKESIVDTFLTTERAEDYFSNKIYGDRFSDDNSFVTTLRALLHNRIDDDTKVSLEISQLKHSPESLIEEDTNPVSYALDQWNLTGRTRDKIILEVFSRYNGKEIPELWLKYFEDHYKEFDKKFEPIEKVKNFFIKSFGAFCVVNPERHITVILADINSFQKLHYLQAATSVFLPWFFDKEETKLTDIEKDLIRSFTNKDAREYISIIEKIGKSIDIDSAYIKNKLGGLERRIDEARVSMLQEQVDSLMSEIQNYINRVEGKVKDRNEKCKILSALKLSLASGDSGDNFTLADYFIGNKSLSLRSVEDRSIYYYVKTYLEFFDEEQAETWINNKRSGMYPGRSYSEGLEKLYRAIFLDQTIKARLCASFELNINGSVEALRHDTYGSEFETYVPNPHYDNYACLGDNLRAINECLAAHNYIGAIDQTVAATKNINLMDTAVFPHFVELFVQEDLANNKKFLELPNGEVVTPMEAIKWLEEKETNAEEKKVEEEKEEENS